MDLVQQVKDLCSGETSIIRIYEGAADTIFEAAPRYNWVGIYVVEGGDLALAAWRGTQPTEHTRIPLSQGVCGFAATKGESVVVDDVNADPRYLACFASTRSEIVVPIKYEGEVVAEIDIDSDELAAFGDEDQKSLEEAAEVIGRRIGQLKR